MDLEPVSLPGHSAGSRLCPCACPFCCHPASPSFRRSMKRRFEYDAADGGGEVAARVEVENELEALREAVENQLETIQELCAELDEERNAADSAASEAMSMILRLQREKAEAQMDARQFKRFAEEKMEHDQQELLDLEELVFKREEAIDDLALRLRAYRDILVCHGIDPDDVDATVPCADDANGDLGAFQYDEEISTGEYPPLTCNLPNDDQGKGDYYDDSANLKKFALRETPHAEEDLESLEHRICELETSPIATDLLEKGVVEEGLGPGPSGHFRSSSFSCYDSIPSGTLQQSLKGEEFPASMDRPSLDDGGADDVSDRVCILDAVHETATENAAEDCVDTQRKKCKRGETDGEMESGTPDIRNLHLRLQELEADRESMRQAMILMRTEKAQLLLLRELAHQLHKDVSPEKKIVKKSSSFTSFSVFAVLKWVMTFILWRKKPSRTRYTFGSPNANLGLLLLLESSPRISNWRLVTGRQG